MLPDNILPDQPFEREGDKKNSDFFEEYLLKIYEARDKSGLTANIGDIHSIYVQVQPGDAAKYIAELSLMSLYRYERSYEYNGCRHHLLRIADEAPDFVVVEPIADPKDFTWAMGQMSVMGAKKPYTRYLGEVLWVEDLAELAAKQKEHGVNFIADLPENAHQNYVHWTHPSIYTWNQTGYRAKSSGAKEYMMDKEWHFEKADLDMFNQMKDLQTELDFAQYLEPIDHLATRIYMHDREHAILEFLTLSSYYFWGSYNIGDQNSSTNICRSQKAEDERFSPAKVFTANNTPYYVNHIDQLPSPTENFVLTYGRRMHHIAIGVKDGIIGPEENDYKNVDFVIDQLKKAEKEFLDQVIGSCEEGLKQIFSKKSRFSWLITEYIQRCYGFQGFFTKENVAALTQAAGQDDMNT